MEPVLFEVAWEVCWQLGGIYTVLRSKARSMLERWDDRYWLVGPYNPATAPVELEERPAEGFVREAMEKLRKADMPCFHGRWLIPGRPRVILLDFRARYKNLDFDKYVLWQDHQISTLGADGEVNDVVAFGFAVAELFKALTETSRGRPILGHFHEWMGGVAVPRIARAKLPVATVFTTHATLLGRYLASDDPEFYEHLDGIDSGAAAARYGILPRFQIERAAAHSADLFTTVSGVTAHEADKILGRKAERILPNGLNIQRFAALHEFQNLHQTYKEKIHEFVMGHFFPSYTFDLDRTLYVFTSGRYEYRNKGMDLFLEAMWRLNTRLKSMPDRPTVVAFIVTRAATRNINVSVLQNQSMFEDLGDTCRQLEAAMGKKLFMAAATGRLPTYQELIPEDAQVKLKRAIHVWRGHRHPVAVTHDLIDEGGDPVLKHLRYRGLHNAPEDPVKVIYHPEFLTATSPLLSLDYEEFVRGCHMGIFPSYYEPWGYTPMEAIALGLPAVTTDLCGFGAYVQQKLPDSRDEGVLVLNRAKQTFERSTNDLVDYLIEFARLNRRARIELRNKVERLGELFDWSVLANHYHEAHDLVLERRRATGTF